MAGTALLCMINSQADALKRTPVAVLEAPVDGGGGLPPLLAQIPMAVRLQLLAETFARLRHQNPDAAIVGAWDAPGLWSMGSP